MNDVAELKRFAVVHAKAQGIPAERYRPLLDRVGTDADWVREWSVAAEDMDRSGQTLTACRYWNMARFPFVDGPDRQEALDRCLGAFDRWRRTRDGIERLDLELPGGRVRCWTSGLSHRTPRPLLVVMGGIVTVKEQWAPILVQARRLGMAGIVTELPGVGENTLPYERESWRMLPGLLDAVRDRADVTATVAVALSFSGHLAVRAAAQDSRIGGIITSGAPVADFFTDERWRGRVPVVTRDTLDHLTGGQDLRSWALTAGELRRVQAPVCYLHSARDEIIPATEIGHLRAALPDLRVVTHDDVHGSPNHVAESRLWVALSILRLRGTRGVPRAALGTLWRAARLRSRLARSAA
ncbi:alpha/beta fold hydrolase [Actinoplanes sp. N902-109]|uniref:alpha/beta fold hydrolase n=1 Tax=Actinoplanes sp. (strain N902-109) TaxID=649831 RepID=UPI0003293A52|nr:hydrolase superfamily dihydrolipoamide acyltransferase-like protein [Actinoplanes sp. N902-109]AGL15970.1 hydrolase superfamily dihydrolipoamide acyltransferase-like protein [Actinoplanes sp. N902-109]